MLLLLVRVEIGFCHGDRVGVTDREKPVDAEHPRVPYSESALKALEHQIVTVKSNDLLTLARGYPLEQYRLFIHDGYQFLPIPFQIEELDSEGQVYMPSITASIIGEEGHFDANDQLIFMYRDLPATQWARIAVEGQKQNSADYQRLELPGLPVDQSLKNIQVISVELAGEAPKYAYLARANRWQPESTSSKQYIDVQEVWRKIKAERYSIQFLSDDPLEGQDFYFLPDEYPEQPVVFDGLKLRVKGKVFGNLARLRLDNKNVSSTVAAVQSGPIRATIHVFSKFHIMSIPFMKVDCQLFFERSSMGVRAQAKLPARLMKLFFWNSATQVTMDGNNLYGSVLEVSSKEGVLGVVDGRMSPKELAIGEMPLPLDNNWVRLATLRNFQTLSVFEAMEGSSVDLSLVYEDDAVRKNKPERFLGQIPNLGYQIEGLESLKEISMKMRFYFDENRHGESGVPLNIYTGLIEESPKIVITDM